jgi:hypothetical protein
MEQFLIFGRSDFLFRYTIDGYSFLYYKEKRDKKTQKTAKNKQNPAALCQAAGLLAE